MPNRRTRRTALQAARRGLSKCDVTHCDSFCRKGLSACGHSICEWCVFNSMRANDFDDHQPHFAFRCPLRRRMYKTAADEVKYLMAKFESAHRKQMSCYCPEDCGKSYWVTHRPCAKGCYDCPESSLELEWPPASEDVEPSEWETEPPEWGTEPSDHEESVGDGVEDDAAAPPDLADCEATPAEQEEDAATKAKTTSAASHGRCAAELKLDEMD